jgi:hypothetical protein
MNKVPKFLALALLSLAVPQSIVFAANPDMSDENRAMQQERDRYGRLNSENNEMKKQDQEMMKAGYDRNQQPTTSTKTENSQYKKQEAKMRGELADAATPRSYPINEDYPFAPRNDNVEFQGKADKQKEGDRTTSYRQTERTRYHSNRQEIGDNSDATRSSIGAPNRDLRDDHDDEDDDDADEASDFRDNHSSTDGSIADSVGANNPPPRKGKQTESGSSRTSSSSFRRSGQR